MAEDVDNIETLTKVIYNVMCIMLRHENKLCIFIVTMIILVNFGEALD